MMKKAGTRFAVELVSRVSGCTKRDKRLACVTQIVTRFNLGRSRPGHYYGYHFPSEPGLDCLTTTFTSKGQSELTQTFSIGV